MPTTPFLPIERMRERARLASDESDAALFFDLMYEAEFLVKLLTLELIAGIQDDKDGHRYQLEYKLVRVEGIGEWAEVLDSILIGPASQQLVPQVRESQIVLTKKFKNDDDAWQRKAIDALISVCETIEPGQRVAAGKGQLALREWVRKFAWLRNRTRGHGSPKSGKLAEVCKSLEESLNQIRTNAPALSRPWAHLHQSLTGKYRVSSFGGNREPFAYLASEAGHALENGSYIFLDRPRRVDLLITDAELNDFFVPNGAFRSEAFELISYITDETRVGEGRNYVIPLAAQPESETKAQGEFEVVGDVFTNMPPTREGYIERRGLQEELGHVLRDDRHPVVTLQGRGGVGKTSLALQALHQLTEERGVFAIPWFSARDIDLTQAGPKLVRPDVLGIEDMANDFSRLMGSGKKDELALKFLTECLSGVANDGPFVFVIDNFETVRDQTGLYNYFSNAVRLPNKVLITTRTRNFKADYPIEVQGMERAEYSELVRDQSVKLGIEALVKPSYEDELYADSNGHPYITKIVLGEVSRTRARVSLRSTVGSEDGLLEALFERSYAALSAGGQRLFLTLCGWRSLVPLIGIKAVMLRPGNEGLDVEAAVVELEQSSMVDSYEDQNSDALFLAVPLAAQLFGKRKLITSHLKLAVDTDLEMLRRFGAATTTDVAQGLGPRVARATTEAAKRGASGLDVREDIRVLESIAREFAPAWLGLARLHREQGRTSDAIESLRLYLERTPGDVGAWKDLVSLYRAVDHPLAEIQARLQLAELETQDLESLSNSVARLNGLLSRKELGLEGDERRLLIGKFLELISAHEAEASATDLSRMAWLALAAHEVDRARSWTRLGLEREPENEHCERLMLRLKGP